jgi:hypothetical protein
MAAGLPARRGRKMARCQGWATLAGVAGFGQSGTLIPWSAWALVLDAIRKMAAGAVQDQMASLGAVAAAGVLLATAWVLGVAALVLLLAGPLGMVGALAVVTLALVLLALAVVGLTRRRNRLSAEARAVTRALWTATAVQAAGTLLRHGPFGRGEARAPAEAADLGVAAAESAGKTGGGHRSALLIGGGIALILLGIFFPSGSEDSAGEEPGPEAGQGSGPGPTDAA